MAFKKEHTEVGNDDICTMRAKVRGVVAFSDTNHKPKAAGMPRFCSDKGIFEYDGVSRWRFEPSGRFQEHVRRWFALQTESPQFDAIHADVEHQSESCRVEHRRTVS